MLFASNYIATEVRSMRRLIISLPSPFEEGLGVRLLKVHLVRRLYGAAGCESLWLYGTLRTYTGYVPTVCDSDVVVDGRHQVSGANIDNRNYVA